MVHGCGVKGMCNQIRMMTVEWMRKCGMCARMCVYVLNCAVMDSGCGKFINEEFILVDILQ